ncbi:hypothetical protein BGZ97_013380 [Linnemannia gamsii]|uniref:Uncharacterized protein n=1 Tax=Linnemannia gamsii TaxID=64522 RepID=A0A9P6UKP7_9FUNG|nr:hypothetical protein BGZ97_013380 [Linnemannia gamsii]
MGIEPLYFGSDNFECNSDLDVHPFFRTNIVASRTAAEVLGVGRGLDTRECYLGSISNIPNHSLIKENCLDDLQRDINAAQGSKLGNIHAKTVCPSAEAPSATQPNGQEAGNTI